MFNIIVAINKIKGIGMNGSIPWKNKEDMFFFKNITTNTNHLDKQNAIIMGRKTFESMNEQPLKSRVNFVISKKKYTNVKSFESLNECLAFIKSQNNIEKIYVIGGSQLYKEALKHPDCMGIFLNIIDDYSPCDTFFPNFDDRIYKHMRTMCISESVTSSLFSRI